MKTGLLNFKRCLVGISMILASTAVFAKPNAVTVTGSFIDNITSSIKGAVFATDIADNAYITVAGETIPPGQTTTSFDITPGTEVSYSIELSSLHNTITMRLVDPSSGQLCDWYVHPNTMAPEAKASNPPVCTLTGAYNYVMRNPTKR